METYTITLIRKFFNRRLKKVKWHGFPDDLNPIVSYIPVKVNGSEVPRPVRNTPAKYLLIIFADETRAVINLSLHLGYFISKNWFAIEAKRAEAESQNQARILSKGIL